LSAERKTAGTESVSAVDAGRSTLAPTTIGGQDAHLCVPGDANCKDQPLSEALQVSTSNDEAKAFPNEVHSFGDPKASRELLGEDRIDSGKASRAGN
jgi:hypothetical protein